jgi:GNAT superfamily N-acetyltransferase
MTLVLRPAVADDADLIVAFIAQLADYEKLAHEAVTTPDLIHQALFCDHPKAFCTLAEQDGVPIGFALWFYNFSTFVGRHGIYLEDLYVQPAARGAGAGKALLASLARRCVDEGLGRLEWSVLDWNAPAIGFYDSLGAGSMEGWTVRRMTGEALTRLASLNN